MAGSRKPFNRRFLASFLWIVLIAVPFLQLVQIGADYQKSSTAQNTYEQLKIKAKTDPGAAAKLNLSPEPAPFNWSEATLRVLLSIMCTGVIGAALEISRSLSHLQESMATIEEFTKQVNSLSETQKALSNTQANLLAVSKTIGAENQLLKSIQSLKGNGKDDIQLQAFVMDQVGMLTKSWIDLLGNLNLVGKSDRFDRAYWMSILSAYVTSEVKGLDERIIATNIELYLKLLEVLTDSENRPASGSLCFFVVNCVLPENWFNLPLSKNVNQSYAPQWLKDYRDRIHSLTKNIADPNVNITLDRVTLVLSDRPEVVSIHSAIKREEDLRKQSSLNITTNGDDGPFDVNRLTLLFGHHAPSYIPSDTSLTVYYIAASPNPTLGTSYNLLEKFINELHPKPEEATYKVLDSNMVSHMETKKLPMEFILAGYTADKAAKPEWLFAVAAEELDLERKTVLVKLYGKDDLDSLVEWRGKLLDGAVKLSDLLSQRS